jgi:hypothetical protein
MSATAFAAVAITSPTAAAGTRWSGPGPLISVLWAPGPLCHQADDVSSNGLDPNARIAGISASPCRVSPTHAQPAVSTPPPMPAVNVAFRVAGRQCDHRPSRPFERPLPSTTARATDVAGGQEVAGMCPTSGSTRE